MANKWTEALMPIGAPAQLGATLADLARDHAAWSVATWGTDRGPVGPIRHIASEVEEIIKAPDDIVEYADILLLWLDACRLAGFTLPEVVQAARDKHEVNKTKRAWAPAVDGEPCFHKKDAS